MARWAGWAILGLAVAGCSTRAATRCEVTDGSAQALQGERRELRYADGSGNAYLLRGAELEYVPVTPARSSSGVYDGGAPWRRSLAPEQVDALWAAAEAADRAQAAHLERRVMGSGQVTLRRGDEVRQLVLAPGSREQRSLDDLLARLTPQAP